MRIIALEEAFRIAPPRSPDVPPGGRPMSAVERVMQPAMLTHVRQRISDFTEYRIPDMDEHGVDVQVLSLGSPGVQGRTDAVAAVDDARRANDFLAEVIAAHPTRFAGLAALPLQNPDAAAKELRRAVVELGLSGALVNGPTLGHYLDEPRFDPVWAELEQLRKPLYLHPHPAPADDAWKVLDGHPELGGAMYRWASDTGAHAMRLVFGGVFDRFPGARLILGHMGEFLPFQLARFDSMAQKIKLPRELTKLPSEYLRQHLAITTSGVCSPAALIGAVHALGIDNVMFAIDYPYEETGPAVRFLHELALAPADKCKIAHSNAERLLGLDPV
ncbi:MULTISPECIES: amidohydrolase family protein [unclassified Streptomyces]|jgi:2,3-dihydroxybenzoate decarboxylase|uniref:amidohydrolase family protein n=1 Tax=unclassified Streptomyces TaxID=2593676 RepID=UPI000FFE7D2A|nr:MULTISPECIES: amidohydrolase family protein [unclassified Streptomyces]